VKFFHPLYWHISNWYTGVIHHPHVGIPEHLLGCPHISLMDYPNIIWGVFSHSARWCNYQCQQAPTVRCLSDNYVGFLRMEQRLPRECPRYSLPLVSRTCKRPRGQSTAKVLKLLHGMKSNVAGCLNNLQNSFQAARGSVHNVIVAEFGNPHLSQDFSAETLEHNEAGSTGIELDWATGYPGDVEMARLIVSRSGRTAEV
ncbi:hypothetical protein JB92DRAFT_3276455, partial [Gautieria morchelliformis]